MKLRFSPKYFKIRTGVISFTLGTIGLSVLSYYMVCAAITDQSADRMEIMWITIGVISGTLLFGFLAYIAWKSYDETLRESDKIMWAVSKWKVIKRWLLDPYHSIW